MIGKLFRAFSNDWKTFSEGNWTTLLREERGRETGGISATKDTKGTKESGVAGGTREESGREST